jgi:integrase
MDNLKIPKNIRIKGLFVYCNKCKSKSKSQLTFNTECAHPFEKQVYKAIITIPKTKRIRAKTLATRDINDAIKQTLDFEKTLKDNGFQRIEEIKVAEYKPQDLLQAIGLYLDYINNRNLYKHQIKVRSEEHRQQVKRMLDRFLGSLTNGNVIVDSLLLRDVNDFHVDIFCRYLDSTSFENRTYNRHIDTVSEFFNFLIKTKHYELNNYFSPQNFIRKRVNPIVRSISIKEFTELLELIARENGKSVLSTGERKYHYYDWLKETFEFALFTGFRRDAVVNVKFSDIYEQDGKPIFIKCEDYKYNLAHNLTKERDKKYIYAPVIKDLYDFLIKIGYNNYKGTDRYIIASNSLKQRSAIKIEMSRSFSHYYKQININNKLNFKHLRKTYITLLNNFTNGKAEVITGHSGQQIIMRSYQDPTVFSDVLMNFQLVG